MKKLLPVLLLSSLALTACVVPYDYTTAAVRMAETATTNVTNAMVIVTTNVVTTSVMMTKTISIMTVMMTAATAATASITMTTTSNTKSTAIRLSSKNVHKSCGYSNDAATKSMKSKPTTVAAARY